MRDALYPPIEPRQQGMLAVDQRHTLYWEESGNPEGVPVLFLHGGPGAGCSPKHRQFFDPAFYRIILFDQRGAGRSTPLGELRDNTTPLLIADIETLRQRLGVTRWLVFGGSWGSTLSLAYAEAHPEHCLGLILRGIFLCRPSEIEWFLRGIRLFYPEVWQPFANFIPAEEQDNLLTAYYRRMNDPQPSVHGPAARAWGHYEGQTSTLLPDPATASHYASDPVALGLGRIEAHYFMHQIFLPENSLLNRVNRIRHLPCIMVQGRHDVLCPPVSAWDLKQAWPEAELIMVEDAGHSAWEPGITRQLVLACESMKQRIR